MEGTGGGPGRAGQGWGRTGRKAHVELAPGPEPTRRLWPSVAVPLLQSAQKRRAQKHEGTCKHFTGKASSFQEKPLGQIPLRRSALARHLLHQTQWELLTQALKYNWPVKPH